MKKGFVYECKYCGKRFESELTNNFLEYAEVENKVALECREHEINCGYEIVNRFQKSTGYKEVECCATCKYRHSHDGTCEYINEHNYQGKESIRFYTDPWYHCFNYCK